MTNQHSADGSTEVAVAELELEEILQHCHFIPIQDSPDSTSAVAIALDDGDDIKATKNDRDIYVVPNLASRLDKTLLESIGSSKRLFVTVKNTLQESTLDESGLTIKENSTKKYYYFVENSARKKLKSLCVSVVYSGMFIGTEHHSGKLDVNLRRLSSYREPMAAPPVLGTKRVSTINTVNSMGMGLITVDLDLGNKVIESGLFELTVNAEAASRYSIRIMPVSFAQPFELEMKRQALELEEKQRNLNESKSKYKSHLYLQQLLQRKMNAVEELLLKDSGSYNSCKKKSDQIEEELDHSNGIEDEDRILLQKLQALSIESKHLASRKQHRKDAMNDLVITMEGVKQEIANILNVEEGLKKEVQDGTEILAIAKKSLELLKKKNLEER